MKYVACPNEVEARIITALEPVSSRGTLDLIGNSGLILVLETGEKFHAAAALLSMHVPEVGDWLVEDDGNPFICPRAVFEKNYTKLEESVPLDVAALTSGQLEN